MGAIFICASSIPYHMKWYFTFMVNCNLLLKYPLNYIFVNESVTILLQCTIKLKLHCINLNFLTVQNLTCSWLPVLSLDYSKMSNAVNTLDRTLFNESKYFFIKMNLFNLILDVSICDVWKGTLNCFRPWLTWSLKDVDSTG